MLLLIPTLALLGASRLGGLLGGVLGGKPAFSTGGSPLWEQPACRALVLARSLEKAVEGGHTRVMKVLLDGGALPLRRPGGLRRGNGGLPCDLQQLQGRRGSDRLPCGCCCGDGGALLGLVRRDRGGPH